MSGDLRDNKNYPRFCDNEDIVRLTGATSGQAPTTPRDSQSVTKSKKNKLLVACTKQCELTREDGRLRKTEASLRVCR